ncbi:MAG: hypothetical protein H6828_09400 [Planctomycetes bacterium]|nr:hypothetical protein [Planctomycetota bacterium]
MRLPSALHAPALLGLALLTSCYGTRNLVDPVVQIDTVGGRELGVTTDYGVVFLGRTARAGEVEVTAWFGDGPSVEPSVIEPVGGTIYTAETEIALPAVPLLFDEPAPGEYVVVIGRDESGQWREVLELRSDPRVLGLLLDVPARLAGREDQIGAGVFRYIREDPERLQLLGLVSGRLTLETADGARDYLTVVGPRDLWRLVTHRRHYPKRKPRVYREDVL